jgi:putative iron-dependent peroxidase
MSGKGNMADSKTPRTYTPQAGIFALGTSSHAYLEFDLVDPNKIEDLVSALAAIREPRTTTGGVNFVIGFRPELWRRIAPEETPQDLESSSRLKV